MAPECRLSSGDKLIAGIGDRFSNLPENIAHHILSFLTMKDHARLSLVSKRCGQFCLSVPLLFIDNRNYKKDADHSHSFSTSLDKFIAQRLKHGIKTREFSLCWSFEGSHCDEDECRINSWLNQVLDSRDSIVEVVHLNIVPSVGKPFALPLSVFQCGSLRTLNIRASDGILKLPTILPDYSKLVILKLKSVRIENLCFGEWVSTFFKSLKVLNLQNVSGLKSISVANPSLEVFLVLDSKCGDLYNINIIGEKLNSLVLKWGPDFSCSTSLTIYAPNLDHFLWTGRALNHYYCVGNLMHLNRTLLYIVPFVQPKKNSASSSLPCNLDALFRSIRRTKTLQIFHQLVQLLFEQGCLPPFSSGLEWLLIETYGLHDFHVPAIAYLLKGAPHLKYLDITSFRTPIALGNAFKFAGVKVPMLLPSTTSFFSMKYWASQNLFFIHQLKKAKMELYGGGNELELIKYLLKHAELLEMMSICYSPPLPSNISYEVNKYKKYSTQVCFIQI